MLERVSIACQRHNFLKQTYRLDLQIIGKVLRERATLNMCNKGAIKLVEHWIKETAWIFSGTQLKRWCKIIKAKP